MYKIALEEVAQTVNKIFGLLIHQNVPQVAKFRPIWSHTLLANGC